MAHIDACRDTCDPLGFASTRSLERKILCDLPSFPYEDAHISVGSLTVP